jgi:hypothetical protein
MGISRKTRRVLDPMGTATIWPATVLVRVLTLVFSGTSTALELSQTYLFDDPGRVAGSRLKTLFPLEATPAAFRFDHRFLNDRAGLALVFLLAGIAPVNAWTARI